MNQTEQDPEPAAAAKPAAPAKPKDAVAAAFAAIASDARTRPAEYVEASRLPASGE